MSVLQEWVEKLTYMQQSVLLTAIRGPDGVAKYNDVKYLLRWYRRCVLLSAMDKIVLPMPYTNGGGSFTGPSYSSDDPDHDWRQQMDMIVDKYIQAIDMFPHHFHVHLMHAIQILGYKHPDPAIRDWWLKIYRRFAHEMYLLPEPEEQMDRRQGDNRAQWLERNDTATIE